MERNTTMGNTYTAELTFQVPAPADWADYAFYGMYVYTEAGTGPLSQDVEVTSLDPLFPATYGECCSGNKVVMRQKKRWRKCTYNIR